MKNALVVVNYNDAHGTAALLSEASHCACLSLILVVDSCSTDDSRARLMEWENERIHILPAEENLGFSHAVNLGWRDARKRLGPCRIAVSNSDIGLCSPNELMRLFDCLEGDVAIAAPVIRQNGTISRGWKLPTVWDDVCMNLVYFHRIYERQRVMYPATHYTGTVSPVEAVLGCFFVADSEFLESCGGLDEGVFLYYEENLLGARVRQHGKRVMVANEIFVEHRHSASVDRSLSRLRKYDHLKKSQYYYECSCNHPTAAQCFLLRFTACLSRGILGTAYLAADMLSRERGKGEKHDS